MRPLRDTTVLFVSGRTGHTLSRVERRWLPVMQALVAEHANVLLVTAPRGPLTAPARDLGVTTVPGRVDRFNIWITRNRLRAYLKRHRPSVAFATDYRADIPLRLAARGLPVKVVSSTRCGGWPVGGGGAFSTWGRRWMERRTRSRVDAFTVDCTALAARLTDEGIAQGRVHLIPPGINIADTTRQTAVAIDLPEGRPRVGYVGALEHSRGLTTLAAAVPAIRKRFADARVVVAGEGIGRIGLLPASLDGRIDLLGRVPSAPAVLAALDVCVFPSTEPGAPTSLVEAAALGRPIVASDVPGIRELLAPDVEIVLVPPGDASALAEAVCELLEQPERARALGQAARLRVIDDYSAAAAARAGVALVRSLSV